MSGTWAPVVGYLIFWLGLIAAIILFVIKKRWYPVMHLISICLYVFTILYIMDVFNMNKNGVLGLLALSSIIMIGIGFYLSKKYLDESPKNVLKAPSK